MSDTKALIKYVRDRLNDGPNITFGKPTVCDLVEALEQAEAESVRLTKMVDWLAGRCGALCNDGVMANIGLEATDWKEAASRAVAGKGE